MAVAERARPRTAGGGVSAWPRAPLRYDAGAWDRIEPLAAGSVRLHLASRHRLSTRFNFYAGAWTDFILADTQRYILEALKRRCEAEG